MSAVFVADESDNPSSSVLIYQRLSSVLPSTEIFDAVDSLRSPDTTELMNYDLVIWYCGSDKDGLYFWNGEKEINSNVVSYLENGGNLWLMGSGFLNDKYQSAPLVFDPGIFAWDYLGIRTWFMETYTDDGGTGVPQLDKTPDNPIYTLTLEMVNWKNPPEPFVDGCKLTQDTYSVYDLGPATYPFSGNYAGFYTKKDGYNNTIFTFDPADMNTFQSMDILFDGIISFYQDLLSGIEEKNDNSRFQLTIYPNPASVSLKATTNLEGETTYKLIDLMGNTVKELKSGHPGSHGSEVAISVGSLPPGMYFLMADNGSVRLSKKIIVNR